MKQLKKIKFTKKTVIILVVIAVILAFIGYSCSLNSKAKGIHMNISFTTLKKTSLQDTVSVSGTVHSNDSHNVYTTLTYPVESIPVSVGDKVKKGDILAVLDTKDLKLDLEQQQYTVQSTKESNSLSLQQAKSEYDNAVYLYNHDLNTDLTTAKSNLSKATLAYNQNKLLYENNQLSKADMDQSQSDYDNAVKSLTVAQKKVTLDLQKAKNAYDSAVLKNNDKSVQIQLEKLERNLKDSVITAPVDGTVTVKNAKVGAVPNGVLFVVENAGDLIVDTEVKEIDTAKIKSGNNVTIKSDATGTKIIKGTVKSVAPAATAKTEGTGNVTFAAKIKVAGQDSGLKIGMKAKLNIITQEKSDVYVVPYDSLVEKNDGTSAVLIAQQEGTLIKAKEVPVQTGLETDVSVEISGKDLKDDIKVLTASEGIKSGDTVQLIKGE